MIAVWAVIRHAGPERAAGDRPPAARPPAGDLGACAREGGEPPRCVHAAVPRRHPHRRARRAGRCGGLASCPLRAGDDPVTARGRRARRADRAQGDDLRRARRLRRGAALARGQPHPGVGRPRRRRPRPALRGSRTAQPGDHRRPDRRRVPSGCLRPARLRDGARRGRRWAARDLARRHQPALAPRRGRGQLPALRRDGRTPAFTRRWAPVHRWRAARGATDACSSCSPRGPPSRSRTSR